MARITLVSLVALLGAGSAHAQSGDAGFSYGDRSAPMFEPAYDAQTRATPTAPGYETTTESVAGPLEHPWAVEVLPDDGGYLVTERPGRLRHISSDGTLSDPISGVPEVENRAPQDGGNTQAGLMDVKIGPDFAENRTIFLTYSKPVDGGSVTAAARGTLSDDMTELTDVEDIFVQEPVTDHRRHYGSRIVFDGEGHAFVTTGEHSSLETRDFAQQLSTTYGKVVRVGLDGSIPEDNPYVGDGDDAVDSIWSYGHRNIQGAALRDGQLFVMEHGPAGGDELNLSLPTRNFGWPIVAYGVRYEGPRIGSGEPRMAGFEEPLYYWDPVIAPGDIVFYDGDMFPDWQDDLLVGGLVSESVVKLDMTGPLVTSEARVAQGVGRVRDIEIDTDGSLLVAIDTAEGSVMRVSRAGE